MQYLVSVIDDTAGLATPDEEAAIGELKVKPGGELQVHGSAALTRWLLEQTSSTR